MLYAFTYDYQGSVSCKILPHKLDRMSQIVYLCELGGLEIYLAMLSLATLDISLKSFILFKQYHADNILVFCGGTTILTTLHLLKSILKDERKFFLLLMKKNLASPN